MNFAFYPFPHSMEQKENSIMRQLILDRAASVTHLDSAAMEQARSRQQQLTKPAGSLGRLEDIAIQMAGITRQPLPNVKHTNNNNKQTTHKKKKTKKTKKKERKRERQKTR